MGQRGASLFRRNDIRRAIRSAQEMGLAVDGFEIDRDGKIVIHTRKPGTDSESDQDTPEQVLKNL
jgi:hypothetical protein